AVARLEGWAVRGRRSRAGAGVLAGQVEAGRGEENRKLPRLVPDTRGAGWRQARRRRGGTRRLAHPHRQEEPGPGPAVLEHGRCAGAARRRLEADRAEARQTATVPPGRRPDGEERPGRDEEGPGGDVDEASPRTAEARPEGTVTRRPPR